LFSPFICSVWPYHLCTLFPRFLVADGTTSIFPIMFNSSLYFLHSLSLIFICLSRYVYLCTDRWIGTCVVIGYRLGAGVRVPVGDRFFSSPCRPASNPMGTGGSFPGDKAAGS
jgi:hypothetical protein